MDSEDSLEDSPPRGGQNNRDEVQEIKRASRLASARAQLVRGPRHGVAGSRAGQSEPYPSASSTASQLHRQQEESLQGRQNSVQFEEARRLRQALEDRECELKECRFEMKQMQSRLSLLQSSEKSWDNKISSATAALKESCGVVERSLDGTKRVVHSECDRLIRLVSGIERHTLHGHHAVASRTTIGLLLKTRHGLENLKKTVLDGSNAILAHATSDLDAAGGHGSSEYGVVHGATATAAASANAPTSSGGNLKVKSDALDGALLDMCKHLEEENLRLESALAVAHAELEELQRESAASKLIPHYRLAIVRARAHATNLADQLQRTQEDNRILRDQLEKALKDMSNNSVSDLKRSAIFEFLNLKAGGRSGDSGGGAATAGAGAHRPSMLPSDPAATEIQAKVVQKELADLDSEIDSLQRQLALKAKRTASTIVTSAFGGMN